MILGNARVDVLKVQVEGATDGESRMLLKTIRALTCPRGFVLAPYPDDVLDHGNVAVVVWRLPVRRAGPYERRAAIARSDQGAARQRM